MTDPHEQIRDPAGADRSKMKKILEQLSRYADVLLPKDAQEPILGRAVRGALFEWMAELNNSTALKAVDCQPRHSALLYGLPGCGKTTFAHHMAARLGMPLVSVKSENLVEAKLGATPEHIATIFNILKPIQDRVVVLFDEFDSIGAKRQYDTDCGREMANALNVLLRMIESFEGIAIAATNRKETLDSALWRRFGIQISIDLPGHEERFAILKRYIAPFQPTDDALSLLAELTEGASPSLLRQLMEGTKRTLIIGPKVKLAVDDPVAVFRRVVATVSPPPEYADVPPLWADSANVDLLSAFDWPMPLAPKEKKS